MVFLPCPPVVWSCLRTGRGQSHDVTLVLPFRAARTDKDNLVLLSPKTSHDHIPQFLALKLGPNNSFLVLTPSWSLWWCQRR